MPTFPLLLALFLAPQKPAAPTVDFAHDLGVGVTGVAPCALAPDALARVARQVGCPPAELADARLFRGSTVAADGRAQPCALLALPLAGGARGGRVVFSVVDGRAHELGLWGALDFDQDPSVRWSTFVEQLRVAGTNETGATVEALAAPEETLAEVEAFVKGLAKESGEERRLARALLAQRQVMRRNGQWVAVMRRGRGPKPEWVAGLAREMHELAELSQDLAPLLGEQGAARHAGFADDVANLYDEWSALLAAEPGGDVRQLSARMMTGCRACHSSATSEGRKWGELVAERRSALKLAGTHLFVGLDVAPALGDDGKVSREIATKVKAGILLAGELAPSPR